MPNTLSLSARLDQQIEELNELVAQLKASVPPTEESAPEWPAIVEIKMKAGKSWGWLAHAINRKLENHPDWTPLKGGVLKSRMGSTMLYRNKIYTFATDALLGSGSLTGGMSPAEIKKAQAAARWWKAEGKDRWKAKREQEEAEEAMQDQRRAEEEDQALREQWERDNAIGQTMEDPEVLATQDEETAANKRAEADAKRARELATDKRVAVESLFEYRKRADFLRSQALQSYGYYKKQGGAHSSEKLARILDKLEGTRDGAVAMRNAIDHDLADVFDDHGAVREGLSLADIEKTVNKHLRTKLELEIDLGLESELARPDSSFKGAARQTATSTGVATLAAVNGAASEIPIVGETYERLVGNDLKESLTREATGVLDREDAVHAVESGNVIGKVTMTAATMVNPTHVAVVGDQVLHGTVEAISGEDLATGRELTAGERVYGGLVAATGAAGALAKVDSTTKFNAAVASMESVQQVPTLIQQAANATSTAKSITDITNDTVTATTGYSPLREKEVSGTERVLAATKAVGSTTKLAADHTQTGKLHKALGTQSGSQRAADTIKKTVKHTKTADNIIGATTGYSPLKERELSDKERLKAGLGATHRVSTDTSKLTDEIARDLTKDADPSLDQRELDDSLR